MFWYTLFTSNNLDITNLGFVINQAINKKNMSYKDRLMPLKLLTLKYRQMHKDVKKVFKIIYMTQKYHLKSNITSCLIPEVININN